MSQQIAAGRLPSLDKEQGLLLASGIGTALGLTLTGQAATILFSAAQSAALGYVFLRALRGRLGWRSAEFVLAASWIVLFTIPCWLYALDPELLDMGSASRAALIVNIALYGCILGLMLRGPTRPADAGPIAVGAMGPRTRVLAAWWLLGFAALSTLLLRHGNPLNYLSRLSESAALNDGAFYIVALALTMRFSALAWAAGRWSRGEPLEPVAIALAVVGTVLIGLTGARLLVALSLVDFLLLYVLLRRQIPLRRVAPWAIAVGVFIVFGVGGVKRYQGYNMSHPDARIGVVEYATNNAPSELASAYAGNYVDTVRLLAIADLRVPQSANWEGSRALLELAVKPLPQAIRPEIERQQVLRETFSPNEQYTYAVPLLAIAFLAGGVLVMVPVLFGVGLLVGELDRRLSSDTLTAGTVAVVVVALVEVPAVLRSGVPAGVTLLLVDVVGMWIVARTGLRRSVSSEPTVLGQADDQTPSGEVR